MFAQAPLGKATGAPSRAQPQTQGNPAPPPRMQGGGTGPPTKVQHLSQNGSHPSLFFSTARGASLAFSPPRDFAHRGITCGDDSVSPEERITGLPPKPRNTKPQPASKAKSEAPLLPAPFVLCC